MAIGRETSESGGVIAPVDVRGAGNMEWASVVGIPPHHPLISEGDAMGEFNIAANHSRIVTTPAGQAGPAGGGLIATPDAMPALNQLDDWRDLFNFKGSPAPWLLLIALGVLVFAHASVQARAGAFGKTASARAALE